MNAHKIETVLTEDGALILRNLPFHAGELVEVIVLGLSSRMESQEPLESTPHPLRGSVIRYDDPFEPAIPLEDWEALK